MCAHICLCGCVLTILTSLDVEDVAADAIPSLRVGQHLNAVVGELLQPSQLHLLTCGCDVLHLSPFWGEKNGTAALEKDCRLTGWQTRGNGWGNNTHTHTQHPIHHQY